MLKIAGNQITITRGNSATIEITPYIGSLETPVILSEDDKVLFTVKDSFKKIKFKKVLTKENQDSSTGAVTLTLFPEDTINFLEQNYSYDCVLIYTNGDAYTFIPSSLFIVSTAIGTYADLDGDNNE